MNVHLCADEHIVVTIDPRTGRLNARDIGDISATGRGPRFAAFSEKLNEDSSILLGALMRLRIVVRLVMVFPARIRSHHV